MKMFIILTFFVFFCFGCIKKPTMENEEISNENYEVSKVNNISQSNTAEQNKAPPYVNGFRGAWYNQNGAIYIVNPQEDNNCEIIYLKIDAMFKVIQNPEIGIVNILDETTNKFGNNEVINFTDRTIMVKNVLYAPAAFPIDLFGNVYPRKDMNIYIPKVGDQLAKKMYYESGIEIILDSSVNEDLIDKLNNSRLIIFNNVTSSPQKYIFKDMELIDYGERYGEGDEIIVELFNENEVILLWKCFSDRSSYPGNYEIRIHYKINEIS